MAVLPARIQGMPVRSQTAAGKTKSTGAKRAASLATTLIVMTVLYFDSLSGAVRYFCAMAGAAAVYYIPFSLVLPWVFFKLANGSLPSKNRNLILAFLVLIFASSAFGLFNARTPMQVGFALYTWSPLFLGLLVASEGLEGKLFWHAKIIWGLAILGVVINHFTPMPWTGQTYVVGDADLGATVQASRDWQAGGVQRLAGFSRASFAAAIEHARP